MGDRGRDRSVSDERVLLEFLLTTDPALFTSEVSKTLPVSRQRVNQILNEMEESKAYVTSKKVSGRRLWWITERGHTYVADTVRECIEDV